MAKLVEYNPNDWIDDITLLEFGEAVIGGQDGNDNIPHKQLGARTLYLKQEVEKRADKNGSAAEAFKVAAAVADNEAVNKVQMETALGNITNLSLITANCLLSGTINATENDTTNTLDIFGDGSCIACYPFENNASDLSGNYNGVATGVSYVDSKYGKGVYCTGVDNKVDTGLLESSFPTISFSMTIRNGNNWFLGARQNNNVNGTSLKVFNSNGFLAFGGLSNNIGWGLADVETDVPYVADKDYSLVVEVETTTIKIYVNGVLKASWSGSARVYSGGNWHICSAGINNPTYSGTIDQVRVFNRVLTLSEISQLAEERFLTNVTLDTASVIFANGKGANGYVLSTEQITSKALSELAFQTGWNEVLITKAGAYSVSQNLSLLAETSDGVSNYFSITDGKYYDKDGNHLPSQAPIMQVLYDGTNIIEVKRVMDFVGHAEDKKVRTWKDKTSQRDFNINIAYGKDIDMPISIFTSSTATTTIDLFIDGTQVTMQRLNASAGQFGVFGIIPAGAKNYKLVASGTLNEEIWQELE